MDSLLTIRELSKALVISERTIRRWCCEGLIPFFKLSHSVRFREKEIETWLQKKARQGRARRRIEI
ncbi:hypothetical protein ES702_04527 [subsurface metagenome]